MKFGESINVGDLTFPTGVEVMTPLDEVVLSIQAPRVLEETEDTAEPQVAPVE